MFFGGGVAASALVSGRHGSEDAAIGKCSGFDPQVPGGRFMIGIWRARYARFEEARSFAFRLRSKAERRRGEVDSEMARKDCSHNKILTEVLTGNTNRRGSKLLTRRLLV